MCGSVEGTDWRKINALVLEEWRERFHLDIQAEIERRAFWQSEIAVDLEEPMARGRGHQMAVSSAKRDVEIDVGNAWLMSLMKTLNKVGLSGLP